MDRAAEQAADDRRHPEQPQLAERQPPANTATPVLRAGLTEVLVTGMLIRVDQRQRQTDGERPEACGRARRGRAEKATALAIARPARRGSRCWSRENAAAVACIVGRR
jgi:hypothetical protein